MSSILPDKPRVAFVVGNFEDRENLILSLKNAVPNADKDPNERDFEKRFGHMGDVFRYFMEKDRILLIDQETQEIERPNRYSYRFMLPISSYNGIIRYNHYLVNDAKLLYKISTKVLSMVIRENPPEDFDKLEASGDEFEDGADIFLIGKREPEEYQSIIKAWFSGSVNPRKYKNSFFNRERYKENKGGIIVPTHNYLKLFL